jgi:hypothetical protein
MPYWMDSCIYDVETHEPIQNRLFNQVLGIAAFKTPKRTNPPSSG